MHRVRNNSPRFNYHSKYKTLHTFKFYCRSVTSLRIIDLRCDFNRLSVTTDSGRKTHIVCTRVRTHARTENAVTHTQQPKGTAVSRQASTAHERSPSAAVCRYTVSKAGPQPHRAQGLMGVLGGTISRGRMCTGGVRGEHAQFTGGLTTRLTTPVTLAPNEKHN